jgi:hypothetical protein
MLFQKLYQYLAELADSIVYLDLYKRNQVSGFILADTIQITTVGRAVVELTIEADSS